MRMSASVWFEEVCKGLLGEIKNTVRYKNNEGNLVPLDDKSLMVRKPEEDFKFEKFPCVSVYIVDYKYDPLRYVEGVVVKSRDKVNNIAVVEDMAVPYNLTCQIDFWTRYQEDMDIMTRTWLLNHFRSFNLSVIDSGGNEKTCNCFTQERIVKSDLVLDKERLFHSILKYQIWVEIDEEICYNTSMVTSINLSSTPINKEE